MKRYILFVLALTQCLFAGAKQWEVKTSSMRKIVFEIPDEYNCVSSSDSSKEQLRYVFDKGNGQMVQVHMVDVENLDIEKAKGAPDTVVVPPFGDYKILDSKVLDEGVVSRVITISNNGSLVRVYASFFECGVFTVSYISPDGDFAEADILAQKSESKFMWWSFLGIILMVVIASIPGFIIASAEECFKYNRARFWRRFIVALLIILAAAIVVPMFFEISFLKVLIIGVVWTAFLCLCVKHGITIV